MVKAYLRYVQQSVLSALVGNLAGVKLIKYGKTTYLVTACNEVVNLTNLKTGELEHQIYDKEAIHGQVSCLTTSSNLIAIGYTSGTVLVFAMETSEDQKTTFEQLHQFSFHKSAVNCLIITDNVTQLISGGADSYIIIYDLVSSSAEYKLMGHSGAIT